jgi:anti-sigma B factor antagonist
MDIVGEKQNGIYIFTVSGRLDSNTSPDFETRLLGVIKDGDKNFVMNFEGVDYISSAGLRVLLKASKILQNSAGKIVLCGLKDYIKEVFEIAGFVTIFPIVSTVDSALNQF